jgi:N-acetylglucosamine-6-phosphate deacetylase
MRDGTYTLGQTEIHLEGRTCTTDTGMLSGSVMTLEEAVENFQRFTGTDLATAVRMASSNPFRMLGLAEPLSVGRPANLISLTSRESSPV